MISQHDAMSHVATALILVCSIAFASSSYAAGRVFFDDFESYPVGTLPTTPWQQDGTRNFPQVVTSSIDGRSGPLSGSKMLRANWNGTLVFNAPARYESARLSFWDYNREFLIRLWLRFDADVDRGFGSKVFRLFPSNGNSFYFSPKLEITNGPIFAYWEQIDGQTPPLPNVSQFDWILDDGTRIAENGGGNWHRVEIYVLHNTIGLTDGILRIWIDGSLRFQKTNVKTSTDNARWYPMYLMSNWSNGVHDTNNHVYWDDIEIYSDTGSATGVTGLMSNATICVVNSTCRLLPPRNVRFLP